MKGIMKMKRITKYLTSAAVMCLMSGAAPAMTAFAEETAPAVTSVVLSEKTIIESTLPASSVTEMPVTTGKHSTITPEDVNNSEGSAEVTLPSGNGVLLEDVLDEDVNRQFLTIQSRNGNTFYIVVDKDDSGHSNVYFMNLVDEYDLLAFAENFPEDDKDGSKKKAEIASSEKKSDTTPSDKEDVASDDTPEDQPPARPSVSGTSLLVPAVIILTLIGGAAFYFFRMKDSGKKSSKKHGFDDEDDFDDDEAADEDD